MQLTTVPEPWHVEGISAPSPHPASRLRRTWPPSPGPSVRELWMGRGVERRGVEGRERAQRQSAALAHARTHAPSSMHSFACASDIWCFQLAFGSPCLSMYAMTLWRGWGGGGGAGSEGRYQEDGVASCTSPVL